MLRIKRERDVLKNNKIVRKYLDDEIVGHFIKCNCKQQFMKLICLFCNVINYKNSLLKMI